MRRLFAILALAAMAASSVPTPVHADKADKAHTHDGGVSPMSSDDGNPD